MCTAVSWLSGDHYFGRNLDLECSYGEEIVITPRNYPFVFRRQGEQKRHYAIIGTAHVAEHYPLYYEGINEKGLCMAGLNFPRSARYYPYEPSCQNVSPYELIPWVLGQCANLRQAKRLLNGVRLLAEPFSKSLPLTPLHWMISDREGSVVLEQDENGLHLYENPLCVMTNEPVFPRHLENWEKYSHLTPNEREEHPESRGMGALGLPGDLSSPSRFVKCAFVTKYSVAGETEKERVSQFFHILTSVEQQMGCVRLLDGSLERTVYSCCCNTRTGTYYYTTYENRAITAVEMHREDLEGRELAAYPMLRKAVIACQN